MPKKTFTCQIEFLEHVLDHNKHNEFLPKEDIRHAHAQLISHQKQLSNSFHGPAL